MQSNSTAKACDECTNRRTNALEQVGENERVDYYGGKAHEELSHFICRHCGAKWLHRVESGAGGHGNFWEREK
jgi:hypothetical protein